MTPLLAFLCRRVFHAVAWLLCIASMILPPLLQAGEYLNAEIVELTASIRQDPGNAGLYLQRSDQYRNHRYWRNARADLGKAHRLGADTALVETRLGELCADQGLHQQAITHLNKALARQPDSVTALVGRAESHRALARPLAAAADYSRAIALFQPPDKALPEYYLQRARAYAEAGDQYLDSALQGLDAGIRELGNIRSLELLAVELERRKGNTGAALQRLDSIIAAADRREFLLVQRGDILLAAGRIGDAVQDFLAASAAIDDLPPSRRHTRSVRALRDDIDARLNTAGTMSSHGQ